ncbi:MAG: hypothetical protein RL720_223 [Actinomycetota bacterium]|jgi:predicted glycosyltransferase involved in capsule biosynthesis
MNLTAVVPFRADDTGERTQNAQAIIERLSAAEFHVILSESALAPTDELLLPEGVERLFRTDEGPFNKAKACNAGWAHARSNVIAFIDADTYVNPAVLAAAIRRIERTDEVIRPFGALVELTKEERDVFLSSGELPATESPEVSDIRGHEVIPATGGIVILSRNRYLKAGGMDESFQGWGGEDDAFSTALRRCDSTLLTVRTEVAYHLWHPRSEADRYAHPHYAQNAQRAAWWAQASDNEVAEEMRLATARLEALQSH